MAGFRSTNDNPWRRTDNYRQSHRRKTVKSPCFDIEITPESPIFGLAQLLLYVKSLALTNNPTRRRFKMKSMKMVKKVQAGFTLIELMIVVAIIGILAAVAIPAYQDYVLKAKFAEVESTASAYKTAVAVCAQELGTLTGCDLGSNGIPATQATTHVTSIGVASGVITVTPTATTNALSTLILTPTMGVGAFTWAKTGSGCLTAQTTGNKVPVLCKL
jgi:prepilin-type N-terminal cleavage/methylation domain-containing protein